MTPPVISVVTSSLNHGHFLRQTIETAVAQTFRNFEPIVVDGGSTDSKKDNELSLVWGFAQTMSEEGDLLNVSFQDFLRILLCKIKTFSPFDLRPRFTYPKETMREIQVIQT